MQKLNKYLGFMRRQPKWRLVVVGILAVVLGVTWLAKRPSGKGGGIPIFAARKGPLEITVLEGGSLQALESQEIKCEVRVGYQGTKILKLVEEGYLVSEEDVKNKKVLVELDSSELQKQIVQQEIQYQTAVASLTDAEQNYEIQLSQNDSDIQTAEQKARFARLDFDKFLGDNVTTSLIAEVGLDKLLAEASTNNVKETSHADMASPQKPERKPAALIQAKPLGDGPVLNLQTAVLRTTNDAPKPVVADRVIDQVAGAAKASVEDPAPQLKEMHNVEVEAKPVTIDFGKYANIDALGDGEAKQKLRKFEDDLQVAQKELGQAKTTLEGTRRLYEKGFVTKSDQERDDIAYENSRLKVATAETARDLFTKYDFLKSAEEFLSKYAESVRELDKARRVAISKLAQAKAKLQSCQGQFDIAKRQRDDLNEQLGKCTIAAQKTGLVVYGGARDDNIYYGGEERVREGASVRERQAIITIPDMTRMSVNVKIHESYIKKVHRGQKARITVDAFPDDILGGEVTKVAVLPDSQNRWMNPDLKVYLTTITIDGTHEWVKPGMSAKAEILVDKLNECVYVPVQAVSADNGKQICYVEHGFKPERREIVAGEFNDEFIEIKNGLKEGERVLLRPPDGSRPQTAPGNEKPGEKPKESPAPSTAPAAVTAKRG
jgi:HlyD family secretion protein